MYIYYTYAAVEGAPAQPRGRGRAAGAPPLRGPPAGWTAPPGRGLHARDFSLARFLSAKGGSFAVSLFRASDSCKESLQCDLTHRDSRMCYHAFTVWPRSSRSSTTTSASTSRCPPCSSGSWRRTPRPWQNSAHESIRET